jgi:hypothetical protein
MTYYYKLGEIPHKQHTQFQQPDGSLYHEEAMAFMDSPAFNPFFIICGLRLKYARSKWRTESTSLTRNQDLYDPGAYGRPISLKVAMPSRVAYH